MWLCYILTHYGLKLFTNQSINRHTRLYNKYLISNLQLKVWGFREDGKHLINLKLSYQNIIIKNIFYKYCSLYGRGLAEVHTIYSVDDNTNQPAMLCYRLCVCTKCGVYKCWTDNILIQQAQLKYWISSAPSSELLIYYKIVYIMFFFINNEYDFANAMYQTNNAFFC